MNLSTTAESTIQVYINQKAVSFSSPPIIQKERVLVPLREILETMEYQVNWNAENQTILIVKNDINISMQIGSKHATKNNAAISLDVPPAIYQNKTYIPLRFVAESTGATVNWNAESRIINIAASTSNENRLLQSVVKIQTDKIQGSGIILSTDGYIATNFHVLEDATMGQIQFQNGNYYDGNITLVGCDAAKDIAIIKINQTGLVPVIFAGSQNIQTNDPVTSIGSPLGKLNVMTTGKILGLNENVISTSAVINHGSSGGALFNDNGQLIGMTSSFGGDNYFSIPAKFIESLPKNLNVPLKEISNIKPILHAPKNISVAVKQREVHISWEFIYGIDYYNLYISSSKDGTYTKIVNPKNKTDQWFWGYPYCFGMTVNHSKEFYLKIVSVKNGVSSAPSEIVKVTIE